MRLAICIAFHAATAVTVASAAESVLAPNLSETVQSKAITPNCVQVPLPTTPSGPSWSIEQQTNSTERVRATVWRVPCGGANAQALVTFTPLAGSPFVCTASNYVIQNGQQADVSYDTNPNNNLLDSLCQELFVPTTAAVGDLSSSFDLNDDAAFTLVLTGSASLGGDKLLNVPAYDPSAYGQSSGPLAITGKLSGSYYDPARSGEGILLEVGQAGSRKVFFVTWYTYNQGTQRWIVGNVDIAAGATSVTVPMFVTSGTDFGSNFNPANVSVLSWGQATFQFPSCSRLTFSWSNNAGQSGTYNYQRTVDGLEGVACP